MPEKSKKELENEEKERQKARKKLEKQILKLFVVLVIVFISFVVAYELLKPKPYFEYEGLKVVPAKIQGVKTLFYVIPISGGGGKADIVIRNDPRNLNISVETGTLLDGINKVWITMPPEISSDAVIAGNDLGSFTSKISLNTSFALTKSDTQFFDQKTCDDATKTTRVFMLDIGNETKVYSEGNCIIVHGTDYDNLIKATDALVMKWLLKLTQ